MSEDRIRISRLVVAEGRYDRIKLGSLLDAEIVATNGFGIFHDRELQAYIRRRAAECGVLTATDSDGAGLLLRNFISGIVPPGTAEHVLIPAVPGKESRKSSPSREGTLGVEGIGADTLRALFLPFADGAPAECGAPVTAADLYADGFSGGSGSRERRAALMRALGLPRNLSTTSLLRAINRRGGMEAYRLAVSSLNSGAGGTL